MSDVLISWASLDDPSLRRADLLDARELERARSFHFARHRERFVAARVALRTQLGELLDRNPAEVPLRSGPTGAPLPLGDLHFSVSHSHDVAAFAFTRDRRVGIDIELPRAGNEAVVKAFHPAERARIAAAPAADRDRELLRCWTAKEAYLKALGVGLLRPLDSFEIRRVGGARSTIHDPADPAAAWCWDVIEPIAPSDAVATLVVDRLLSCSAGSAATTLRFTVR